MQAITDLFHYCVEHYNVLDESAYELSDSQSQEIHWWNKKDATLSIKYSAHAQGVWFTLSEYMEKSSPNRLNHPLGYSVASIEVIWYPDANKIQVVSYWDDYIGNNATPKPMTFRQNYNWPLTEEEHFQQSLVNEPALSFEDLNKILCFMEIFYIHKDEDIMEELRKC